MGILRFKFSNIFDMYSKWQRLQNPAKQQLIQWNAVRFPCDSIISGGCSYKQNLYIGVSTSNFQKTLHAIPHTADYVPFLVKNVTATYFSWPFPTPFPSLPQWFIVRCQLGTSALHQSSEEKDPKDFLSGSSPPCMQIIREDSWMAYF